VTAPETTPIWPSRVTICEVGPRDGFQMEKEFIPTTRKVEIINTLSRTGVREIQATSFVHPGAIPQLADAEEVMARIDRVDGVTYTGLVANPRGAARAVSAAVDRVEIVVSTTDSHSLSNTNMTTAAAMDRVGHILEITHDARVPASIGFATALGCPFEGFPEYERVAQLVRRSVDEYAFGQVSIADTAGMADPARVRVLMARLHRDFPATTFSLHLHDTRRMGLANVVAGLEAGVTKFDAAVAGLGGCPYAPGATGNVATEDVIHMLSQMGIETGIDLDAVIAVGQMVAGTVGHADAAMLRAGPSTRLLGAFAGRQEKLGNSQT
jgi:hydroxymethylglutaryl-CoA lyase